MDTIISLIWEVDNNKVRTILLVILAILGKQAPENKRLGEYPAQAGDRDNVLVFYLVTKERIY